MAKYKVQVTYAVSGEIEIEANSKKEAILYAKRNIKDLELPEHVEYVCDSYEVNEEDER